VNPDSIVTMMTPGGGGYGDARERDRDLVLADVADGYVSVEAARSTYGVEVAES
jgi:N-methylhydantoinase B